MKVDLFFLKKSPLALREQGEVWEDKVQFGRTRTFHMRISLLETRAAAG